MKKFLIGALLSTSMTIMADVSFESGNNKNHIMSTFQNNECKESCNIVNNKLYKYDPQNLFILRFDDNRYQYLHKFYSTINDVDVVSPQFFLNHSVINNHFFENVDLRELNNDLVGNLKINFDNKELKANFYPLREIKNGDNLNTFIKGDGDTSLIKDEYYDNKELTLFVAITTPNREIYSEDGVNEGHFVSNNNNVLFLESISSTDLNWNMNIPYKSFNEDSLSFVVWIEDDKKNIIQSSSHLFYRFSY